ncbi:MAG: nucleotide pyrophosphohydrolase [Proteobacteria bacterium]|nr:nucleotide pyrophosphohydrolase [Pseudomonadota bacterium]NQW45796.1 nucleotide pyrophosphohydrolase [Deltaproteobacteria bacterium]
MAKHYPFNLNKLLKLQRKFVKDREWDVFHTPKNLSMALAGEAGELVEIFQWLTPEESFEVMKSPKTCQEIQHELADILYYTLRMADRLDVDLEKALIEKLKQNAKRYPVKLAKGNAKKYTELK